MTTRTVLTIAAFGIAALTTLSAGQASAAPHQSKMNGQSAAAGTAFDADRRAEFVQRRQPMVRSGNEMGMPYGPSSMIDSDMLDRAARPDRQR